MMSFTMTHYSRMGVAICLILSMSSSGCATWNKLLGKKEEPSPKLNLAWAKLKESEGNLTDARHGYEEVLSKDPKNVDAVLGMARLNLKAKRIVEAEAGFERALAMKPQSPEVLTEIGNFYSDQQRWDKAIPLLQNAQRLEPHEKAYHYNLAMALAKSGRSDDAIPHFIEAVGEAPAHYNVGRILLESGKRSQAEEQFALALAKDPNLTDAQFYLEEIRTGTPGTAEQVPVIVDRGARRNPALQVAGTEPIQTAEKPNPFEEAPTSGYSRNATVETDRLQDSNSGRSVPRAGVRPIPSGREPLYPHGGFEELEPPRE